MVQAYLDMEEKNKSVEKQQVEEEIESQQQLDLIQCNNDELKQREATKEYWQIFMQSYKGET